MESNCALKRFNFQNSWQHVCCWRSHLAGSLSCVSSAATRGSKLLSIQETWHAKVPMVLQEQASVKVAEPGTAAPGLLQNKYHIQASAAPYDRQLNSWMLLKSAALWAPTHPLHVAFASCFAIVHWKGSHFSKPVCLWNILTNSTLCFPPAICH